jgi:DNA (cytosine-5)-methyltransferase 1
MRILNLYAGIGGNRKLWGDEHKVVAIEFDPNIAKIYQDFYPNDTVITVDAHKYLLEHFAEFDFIWSSPPCPTHSKLGIANIKRKKVFPDMKLYEEILFLKHYFKGKYVVENVMSYYEPLVKPQILQRHYFWANFEIPPKGFSE